MFTPKKTKFKKQQKGKNYKKVTAVSSLHKLHFGSLGLKAISAGSLSSKQIEGIYQNVRKIIKKSGRLTINILADTPVSRKPNETRMGKGKGGVDHWICKIKLGTMLCEIEISTIATGVKALMLVQYRLPIKTKIIYN
jgi:large subunit ribosomal protein L16